MSSMERSTRCRSRKRTAERGGSLRPRTACHPGNRAEAVRRTVDWPQLNATARRVPVVATPAAGELRMTTATSGQTLTSDQALAIAQADAARAYGDLSLYAIRLAHEADGWHVDYELKDPK